MRLTATHGRLEQPPTHSEDGRPNPNKWPLEIEYSNPPIICSSEQSRQAFRLGAESRAFRLGAFHLLGAESRAKTTPRGLRSFSVGSAAGGRAGEEALAHERV